MAVAQQRVIHSDAIDPELKPIVRAALSRAFVELEMLKLRLRMKPAPKPIDVSVKPPSKRPRNAVAFTEDSGNQSQQPIARPAKTSKASRSPRPSAAAGPAPTSQASET